MREKGDYSRAEEYLEDISDQIEYEYGEPYNKLPREAQVQAILDHFFKGIKEYRPSAVALRVGMGAVKGFGSKFSGVYVSFVRGRRVIRDEKTGRFKQWVKE